MSKLINTLNLIIVDLKLEPECENCTLPMNTQDAISECGLIEWCMACSKCAFSLGNKSIIAGALNDSINKIT